MISRLGNKGFFAAHYEWVLLGAGALSIIAAGVFFATTLGEDPETAASSAVASVNRMRPSETGVKAVDLSGYQAAMRLTRTPVTVAEVSEKSENFLASERRVLCSKCKKAISGDVRKFPACPFCGEKQQEEPKVVLDTDADGIPDEWEKKYGLNLGDAADANADADGDDFTNLEEFQAKTDPTNKNDHPDYLDSLKVTLPLKKTYMPFIFTGAMKIPSGWRCDFFNAREKDDYGRLGKTFKAAIGEEIGKSGFVLKAYEAKSVKEAIKGGKGMVKVKDVSEVTVVRKSDGKVLKLVFAESKKVKPAAVDVQATLTYERGQVQTLEVVPGSEIELSGIKYRVAAIEAVGKGAKVTIETSLSGKKRVIEALEQ